jgi:hypothetical protein
MANSRGVDWSAVPLHSVLAALYFPLYLLAANADEWVNLSVAIVPILACVGLGAAVLAACAAVFGGWQRGGLVATLLIVLFFTAGRAVIGLNVERWVIAVAWLGLALLGLTLIARGARWHGRATVLLNVATLVIVAVNALSLGSYLWASSQHSIGQASAVIPLGAVEQKPDIYYLVFDRYAGETTLRDDYGFDNAPFLAALEDRGFTVAHHAWANYAKTSLSLGSSLNADFLDADALRAASSSTFGPIHAALRGHLAVPQTLTSIGYEYVHIGTWWEPTQSNIDADEVLVYGSAAEYPQALAETTALGLLTAGGPPTGDDPEVLDQPNANMAFTRYEFDQVERAASRPGPTFVFAHFLVPHPPYVFNRDGSQQTAEQLAERGPDGAYVEQLRWTNGRILELLDVLLAAPPEERPIVIVQADEGPYPARIDADQDGFAWFEATDAEIAHKFAILNALYLPNVDAATAGVTDRTSPVNNFRIVLNAYFGTELPLRDDTSWLFPDQGRLYDFSAYDRPD